MKTPFLLFVTVLIFSCSSAKQNSSENPTEDIAWIKEYIAQTKKSPFPTKAMIMQYKYNGEVVFLVDGCYECPDATATLYNTKKEVICTFGGMVPKLNNTCPYFDEKATDKKLIWKNF